MPRVRVRKVYNSRWCRYIVECSVWYLRWKTLWESDMFRYDQDEAANQAKENALRIAEDVSKGGDVIYDSAHTAPNI